LITDDSIIGSTPAGISVGSIYEYRMANLRLILAEGPMF
jgi:hypothetical protein